MKDTVDPRVERCRWYSILRVQLIKDLEHAQMIQKVNRRILRNSLFRRVLKLLQVEGTV